MHAVGICTDVMNYHAVDQEDANWCWAACIQMAYSTRGFDVSQSEIVARAFGEAANLPGSPMDVLANLNGRMCDRNGRTRVVVATPRLGPPSLDLLRRQFEQNMPLIVGYDVPGQSFGHAVVVTAAIYEDTTGGQRILRLLARDPRPASGGEGGKRELTADEFSRITVHYLVEATRV